MISMSIFPIFIATIGSFDHGDCHSPCRQTQHPPMGQQHQLHLLIRRVSRQKTPNESHHLSRIPRRSLKRPLTMLASEVSLPQLATSLDHRYGPKYTYTQNLEATAEIAQALGVDPDSGTRASNGLKGSAARRVPKLNLTSSGRHHRGDLMNDYLKSKTDHSALMLQICGTEAEKPCQRCSLNSVNTGRWVGCIIPNNDDHGMRKAYGGACANCCYQSKATCCSLRSEVSLLLIT